MVASTPVRCVTNDGCEGESMGQSGRARYVIVALFDRLERGVAFRRERWPAHVTLVSNFVTGASVDEIVSAVRRAVALDPPLRLEFGDVAAFGPKKDIPVRLVLPGPVIDLHRRLADELTVLPDLVPDEPAYWREGYRPHLTLSATANAEEGERRTAGDLAIMRLDGGIATVVAASALPGRASESVSLRRGSGDDARALAMLKAQWARDDTASAWRRSPARLRRFRARCS